MAFISSFNPKYKLNEIRHFGEVNVSDAIYGRSAAIDLCSKHDVWKVMIYITEGQDIEHIVHASIFVNTFKIAKRLTNLRVAINTGTMNQVASLAGTGKISEFLELSVLGSIEEALKWLFAN